MKFVTYLRVSTERQGQSGLGLEAQRAAVAAHVPGRGEVVAEFIEIESGKLSDRPELARALAAAKGRGGPPDRQARPLGAQRRLHRQPSRERRRGDGCRHARGEPVRPPHHGGGCRAGGASDFRTHPGGARCGKSTGYCARLVHTQPEGGAAARLHRGSAAQRAEGRSGCEDAPSPHPADRRTGSLASPDCCRMECAGRSDGTGGARGMPPLSATF
ncbi:Resolvase, N terminal domain [[Luteovulum] sphaeroides subsp. megalophilum]|nr:Resolvase, N terminal domain [[Luteovulum] sphaeroides subsp. megalophilum]